MPYRFIHIGLLACWLVVAGGLEGAALELTGIERRGSIFYVSIENRGPDALGPRACLLWVSVPGGPEDVFPLRTPALESTASMRLAIGPLRIPEERPLMIGFRLSVAPLAEGQEPESHATQYELKGDGADLSLDRLDYKDGELAARLSSVGNLPVPAMSLPVALYVDGAALRLAEIAWPRPLAPGESMPVSLGKIALPDLGAHRVEAVLDPRGHLEQAVRANDRSSLDIPARGPNLAVDTVHHRSGRLFVRLVNKGRATLGPGSGHVVVTREGVPLLRRSVSWSHGVAVGGDLVLGLGRVLFIEGAAVHLTVRFEPNAGVADSDPRDNVATVTLSLESPSRPARERSPSAEAAKVDGGG